MMHEIDMKRLHLGCGESLQSNLRGISIFRRPLLPDVTRGRRQKAERTRLKNGHRRHESDFR